MRARWEHEPRTGEWVLATWTEGGDPIEVYGTLSASSLTAVPAKARQTVAERIQEQHGMLPPARVFDGRPGEQVSLTCGLCWGVSFGEHDAKERYCPTCKAWPELDDQLAKSGPPPVA